MYLNLRHLHDTIMLRSRNYQKIKLKVPDRFFLAACYGETSFSGLFKKGDSFIKEGISSRRN